MTNQSKVGILGGGISGLSAAYALQKKGISSAVYEYHPEVGGSIRTRKHDQWLIEEGPNTLMVKSQSLWDLLDELELTQHIQTANEEADTRYVAKNGSMVPVPSSPVEFLTTSLFSTRAKLRLLKEPFIPSSTQADESVSAFITRRLGREPLDYGVNPFVSGIYAGDPDELSIKYTFNRLWEMEQKHGSLFKGMISLIRQNSGTRRSLISFDEGNQLLPRRIAERLEGPVLKNARVSSAAFNNEKWIISGMQSQNRFENQHAALISTIPAYQLPEILKLESVKNELYELATLPYAPLSVITLGYRNEDIRHPLDGFGLLIPEKEGFQTLGALFPSTLFPGRAPEGHKLLTCFIGGARNPKLARKSGKELIAVVQSELDTLLGIGGDPVFSRHTFWERAIPQYRIGYDDFLILIGKIEEAYNGLFLDGSFREGVAVPDCIASGFETSQKAYLFLSNQENKS